MSASGPSGPLVNFSFCHSYITHMDMFHQSFLRNYLIKENEIFDNFVFFSESVTTSNGYRRGYVSFAHFLLYCCLLITLEKQFELKSGSTKPLV